MPQVAFSVPKSDAEQRDVEVVVPYTTKVHAIHWAGGSELVEIVNGTDYHLIQPPGSMSLPVGFESPHACSGLVARPGVYVRLGFTKGQLLKGYLVVDPWPEGSPVLPPIKDV